MQDSNPDFTQALEAFRSGWHREHRSRYEELAEGQNPHTLFVTCSDSRILPERLTGTKMGELFVLRNVANQIPPPERAQEFPSAVASLEFAVKALGVSQIIICGHSNCGGCAHLLSPPEQHAQIPHTSRWMSLAEEVVENIRVQKELAPEESMAFLAEKENVRLQVANTLKYDFVQQAVSRRGLKVLGWHYSVGNGQVLQYDSSASEDFFPVN